MTQNNVQCQTNESTTNKCKLIESCSGSLEMKVLFKSNIMTYHAIPLLSKEIISDGSGQNFLTRIVAGQPSLVWV